MTRKKNHIHQQFEKTTEFVINAKFGTPAFKKKKELELPIRIVVDKEGVLYARAQAEKRLKALRNEEGIYLREIRKKSSRVHKI